MPLPKGIFESFQETPGTPLEENEQSPMLDTLNPNSPMAKILANSKKMMESKAMAVPLENDNVEREISNSYVEQIESKQSQKYKPVTEEFYSESDEKDFPAFSTEDLLRKIKSGAQKTQISEINQSQRVQNQPKQTYVPTQIQTTSVIDYSLINTMLKSIIAEEIKNLKTQILTEGKNSSINEAAFMTIGNTIKFVDKKGNMFEGKLKLVGNVNHPRINPVGLNREV